jgi:O-antigen/teichoic acid export membrane protein
LLTPFTGLVAGSASEIITLVFGPAFEPAAPLLSWLIFAALALVQVSVATAILTAAGRPGLTLALTGPLPFLALSGYVLLIPQLGPPGAALVTTLCATTAALATVLAVLLVCQASPPIGSLFRSILLGVGAYAVGAMWATPGFLVLVKLPLTSLAILFAFGLLGEFSKAELTAARALLSRQPATR